VYKILGGGLNGIYHSGDFGVDVTAHTRKTSVKEVGWSNAYTLWSFLYISPSKSKFHTHTQQFRLF